MKTCKTSHGFTLVEIIVVCGIVTIFLGTAIMLFTNFRRGYSRSEGNAALMQDGALFLARLRTDLNNAVLVPDTSGSSNPAQLSTTANQLSFMVYSSREARALPVIYRYQAAAAGGTIFRKEGDDNERALIKDRVASLTWQTDLERYLEPEGGSGTVRLSIALALELKMKQNDEKAFPLKVSIFPARLNRQLNNP
jgi:Tfp pilus assembly protein PilE